MSASHTASPATTRKAPKDGPKSKSSVSRRFVNGTAGRLAEFRECCRPPPRGRAAVDAAQMRQAWKIPDAGTHNVKRWQPGDTRLRRAAAGMVEAASQSAE